MKRASCQTVVMPSVDLQERLYDTAALPICCADLAQHQTAPTSLSTSNAVQSRLHTVELRSMCCQQPVGQQPVVRDPAKFAQNHPSRTVIQAKLTLQHVQRYTPTRRSQTLDETHCHSQRVSGVCCVRLSAQRPIMTATPCQPSWQANHRSTFKSTLFN